MGSDALILVVASTFLYARGDYIQAYGSAVYLTCEYPRRREDGRMQGVGADLHTSTRVRVWCVPCHSDLLSWSTLNENAWCLRVLMVVDVCFATHAAENMVMRMRLPAG